MAIGPDRVQVLKQESSAGGGDPADDPIVSYPVPIDPLEDVLESAGGFVQAPTESRDETVAYYRHQGEFLFIDQAQVSGRSLSQLLGLSQRSCFTTYTRVGGLITAVITWTSSGMTQKVQEMEITYAGDLPLTIVERHYDRLGAVQATFTTTITRLDGLVQDMETVET